MARADIDPEDRDQMPIRLNAVLECPKCGVEFDYDFVAPEGVFDIEDLIEAPVESVTCPLGHEFSAEYEGWQSHGDAG